MPAPDGYLAYDLPLFFLRIGPSEVMSSDSMLALVGQRSSSECRNLLTRDVPEFDEQLGIPGLHQVAAASAEEENHTILPAGIVQGQMTLFWDLCPES